MFRDGGARLVLCAERGRDQHGNNEIINKLLQLAR